MVGMLRRQPLLSDDVDAPGDSLSELYHENSKLVPALTTKLADAPEMTNYELEAISRAYKRYRNHTTIALPGVSALPGMASFDHVIEARRSARTFSDVTLELEALGKILHQTYGITGKIHHPGEAVQPLRASPSAGALFPAEIYLAIRHVSGIAPGVYHYEVPQHALALLSRGYPEDKVFEICLEQEHVRRASVVVLISAVMSRTKRKYGERGYRYVLLDIGHLAQNLSLASTALGVAVTTSGGFWDDGANGLLRLHGIDEVVMYIAFLGKET